MITEKEIIRLKVKCNNYAKRLVLEGFDDIEWEITTVNRTSTDKDKLNAPYMPSALLYDIRHRKDGHWSWSNKKALDKIYERDRFIRAESAEQTRKEAAERAVKCLCEFEDEWIVIDGKVCSAHEQRMRLAILNATDTEAKQ